MRSTFAVVANALALKPHLGASQRRRWKHQRKQAVRRSTRTVNHAASSADAAVFGHIGKQGVKRMARKLWWDGDGAHTRFGFVQRILLEREFREQRRRITEADQK